jgi:hypothetical protein
MMIKRYNRCHWFYLKELLEHGDGMELADISGKFNIIFCVGNYAHK